MNSLVQDFLTALRFLTIFPVSQAEKETASLAKSMIFFPAVGFLIGLISLGIIFFVEPLFSPRIGSLLLVLLPILFTGGLHVDGFADFFDAFFGRRNKEKILQIMKDPRIGAWGAASIVFLILLKWELLMILPLRQKGFLLALTVSRWVQVLLSAFYPSARATKGSLGEMVGKKVQTRELLFSSLSVVIVSLFLGFRGLLIVCITALFSYAAGQIYKRKLGGITGDILGATGEMAEVLVFAFLILTFHQGTV